MFMLKIETLLQFASVNDMFLTTTGLNEEQVIGRYVQDVIPPTSQNFYKQIQRSR